MLLLFITSSTFVLPCIKKMKMNIFAVSQRLLIPKLSHLFHTQIDQQQTRKFISFHSHYNITCFECVCVYANKRHDVACQNHFFQHFIRAFLPSFYFCKIMKFSWKYSFCEVILYHFRWKRNVGMSHNSIYDEWWFWHTAIERKAQFNQFNLMQWE